MYDLYNHPTNGKCLIYGRVSTESELQENSLKVQTMDNEDFSFFDDFKRKYNYETYAIYNDESSGTTENREDFQNMLKFLGIEQKILYTDDTLPTGNKKKQKHYVYNINQSTLENVKNNLKINYILCKNTSRWTRRGNQELIYTLRTNGIYIYFKDENIDTFNRESDTLLGIIQQLDRNKSIDTSKKVKSGFEASIKLKKIRTNSFIYGYELIENKNSPSQLKPIPEESKIVREIFRLYTGFYKDKNGKELYYGSRQIKNILDERGIKTRIKTTKKGKKIGGVPFSISSIKRILQNEKYCGYVNTEKKWQRGELFTEKASKKLYGYTIDKCDYILEPIIDLQMFLKAERICRERSEKNSKRGRNTGHSIYSKKIMCGICNEWYSQNGEKNKNGEYIKKMNCSNKKKNGLKVCNNNNLSFKEIERRYKELQENFESFIKIEKWKQKKELLFILIPIFEYYFSSSEEQIEELKIKITDINTLADELMIQRIGLTPSALTLYNDRLNALAEEREKLLKELDYIYKYYDKIRPFIDNILNALETLEKLDETKKVSIEDLLNYDIIMINYYDKYEWKIKLISLEETYNFFEDIGIDVNLYMGNYEKYDPTKEELNKMLSKFYKEYKANKEYYF